jgi:hypothetical protein
MTLPFAANNFFPEEKSKSKSDELDRLKEIQKLIDSFNENQSFHYLLRLKYGLRRAWYK